MKSKFSTGYLTPPPNRSKKVQENQHNKETNNSPMFEIDDDAFQKMISCPIKRKLVLKLIQSEKHNIEKYKQKLLAQKEQNGSPLHKIQKRPECESPTALLRRRALAIQAGGSPLRSLIESPTRSNSVNSTSSEISSNNPSPVPFEKLLAGVIAFVEVKSKGQDRSGAVKALMVSMGATVRDTFTRDVTHVVFKDGSYTTFQKAKLMNIHFVSVLWIESVRSNQRRVPERKFPALGTDAYDHNVSKICSQMQKEYEELIKDELQKSLISGSSLPSRKTLIDRRRSMMTPDISSASVFKDMSSQGPSSQDDEVEQIIRRSRITKRMTMGALNPIVDETELVSDDDDESGCNPIIDGDIITKRDKVDLPLGDVTNNHTSNMDLTGICHQTDGVSINTTSNSIYELQTPQIRQNRNNDLIDSDQDMTGVQNESLYRRHTRVITPSINETLENSKDSPNGQNLRILSRNCPKSSSVAATIHSNVLIPKATTSKEKKCNAEDKENSLTSHRSSEAMDVEENVEKVVIEQNLSSHLSDLKLSSTKSSTMSSLKISEKSSSANMSVLQISSDKSSLQKTSSSNMSALHLSSEAAAPNPHQSSGTQDKLFKRPSFVKKLQDDFSSAADKSFSPLQANTITDILQTLHTPSPSIDTTANDNQNSKSAVHSKNRKVSLNVKSKRPIKSDDRKTRRKTINITTNRGGEQTEMVNDLSKNIKLSEKEQKKTDENKGLTRRRSTRITNVIRRKSACPAGCYQETSTSSIDLSPPEKAKEKSKTHKRKSGENPTITDASGVSPTKKTKDEKDNETVKETGPKNPKIPSELVSSDIPLRRVRKLYDPDTVGVAVARASKISDDNERHLKRQEIRKKVSDDGVFITASALTNPKTNSKQNAGERSSSDTESSEIQVPTRIGRRKRKSTSPKSNVNADRDEQRELAREIIGEAKANAKTKSPQNKTCQSAKKKPPQNKTCQSAKKKLDFNNSSSQSTDEECIIRPAVSKSTSKITRRRQIPVFASANRRSTLEFQPKIETISKNKLKIDKLKQPSIVCTKFHKDDIMIFNQIVKKLGKFVIEDEVSSKTTHLVAGEPKRTINMLRAIATGCWILKREWLFKSLEAGKWLPEEDYEQTDFSSAVQESRLHRQAFGPTYTMDIFKECPQIYVAKGSVPRCSDLRDLITLCKGKVTTILRNATILVGGFSKQPELICVKETWILDSITKYKKLPFKSYLIKSDNRVVI